MAYGAGIQSGRAFVEFYLKSDKFKKGLSNITAKITAFGKVGAAATAPLVAGFTAAATAFTSLGSELADLSKRSNLSVETLSELKYVASQTGTSLDAFGRGAKNLQRNIGNAALGNGTFSKTLRELGIDLGYIQSLDADGQFNLVADAISRIQDPTVRAAMAAKVFGKTTADDLMPALLEGSKGMSALRERARAAGLTMSGDAAAAADQLGDSLGTLKDQLFRLAAQVGESIAGDLQKFLDWSEQALSSAIAWVRANPEYIASIARITAAVAAASAAVLGFATALTILTTHPIIALLAIIAGALVGLKTYFSEASTEAEKFAKSLGEVEKQLPEPSIQAKQIQAQAIEGIKRMEMQIAAPSSRVASAGRQLVDQISKGIERNTRDTVQRLDQILTIMRSPNGGLVWGTG